VDAVSGTEEDAPAERKGKKKAAKSGDATEQARKWMCQNFWDVRAFGAVMTTGVNCGQVRGPVQLTFGRSVGPILALEHAITRKSITTEDDAEKQMKKDGSLTGTIGRKTTIPYGLYRCHGFVSPQLAAQTGFHEGDLSLLWRALLQMFEQDRSATRGQMSARGLYVFKHNSALGNAPSHRLQAAVKVSRNAAVVRSFADFTIEPPTASELPSGVELLTFDCNSFGIEPTVVASRLSEV
jgi:CRISPR-associated protein Csd2